jgi:type I restriction enzyme R subunit
VAFTEKELVEDFLADGLQRKGWRFVPADGLERDTYDEPLLTPILLRSIERLNPAIGLGEEEVHRVVNELTLTPTGAEGSKRILDSLKFGVPIKIDRDKVVRYVRLFDFHDVDRNDFIVTRQAIFQGRERIRTDLLLYVNGIPLVSIECKNPAGVSEDWHDAYAQIKRYERAVPELYKYVQIGVAAESVARYFPIVPWQAEVRIHEWREEGLDPLVALLEMLAPATLLDIVRSFLFHRIERGEATKVVCRYMQYRAANRIVDRVVRGLGNEDEKKNGLIWHWQGSGKTLTMIFAANKLFYRGELENPTILFIVDRIELEEQIFGELNALDVVAPEVIGSIADLERFLAFDDHRGRRGVFIVLVHKFQPERLRPIERRLEALPAGRETIMNRENVIAFIDEGHRTQNGLFATQMKSIFRGARFFAFTGTPISKRGRDTYGEFSYPPEEAYLDRYFITDSMRDGFTVRIVYQPRLEREVHLRKEDLEAFLESEFEEIPEAYREGVKEAVRKRLNLVRMRLENPQRIAVIAEDIAGHFRETVDGRFKAMVVAGSQAACTIYKDELDRHLPFEDSEIVMSYQTKSRDPEDPVYARLAETRERYGGREIEDVRKMVVERFREEERPKILIVTDMLLTGFDAPILQTLYLDKPLQEHRLLQAVARTNRPYRGLKAAGLVVDYVGVLKAYRRALEMYSREDLTGALLDMDGLRADLLHRLDALLGLFEGVSQAFDRDALLDAIERLTSDSQREAAFLQGYRALRRIFEILGPDVMKLPRLEAYKWLSAVYIYHRKVVAREPDLEADVRRYFEKTLRYVHRTTEIEKLNADLPAVEFDEQYLSEMEERVRVRRERAANILFTLNRFVLVDRHRNPVYESLVEKVERLVGMWRDRARDYEAIYREGREIVEEIDALTRRQREIGFSDLEYAMLLVLEEAIGPSEEWVGVIEDLAGRLEPRIFPGWTSLTTATKEVEREVRRFARRIKKDRALTLEEMNALYERLIDRVRNFGAE